MSVIAKQRYVEDFPLDQLKPHPKNPRLHDLDSITESIEENQFAGAILAQDGTNFVLSGHGRLKVLAAEGVTHGPVIFIECDDDRAEKLVLALNRVGEKSDYDKEILAELLMSRAEVGDLLGTGYSADDVDDLLAEYDSTAFDIEGEEFTGGYIEPAEDAAQRATREAVTKASRGLKETVLVLDTERHETFVAAAKVCEEFYSTSNTSDTVFMAVTQHAKDLQQ